MTKSAKVVRFTTDISFELPVDEPPSAEAFIEAFEKALTSKYKLINNPEELRRRLRLVSQKSLEGFWVCDPWRYPVRVFEPDSY